MTREEAIYWIENLSCSWEGQYREARDMAISALREQPRWISVEERLPEPDTDVLARRATGMDVECYHEEAGGYWTWDGYSKGFVTHWMPLPEGPGVEV